MLEKTMKMVAPVCDTLAGRTISESLAGIIGLSIFLFYLSPQALSNRIGEEVSVIYSGEKTSICDYLEYKNRETCDWIY